MTTKYRASLRANQLKEVPLYQVAKIAAILAHEGEGVFEAHERIGAESVLVKATTAAYELWRSQLMGGFILKVPGVTRKGLPHMLRTKKLMTSS